MQSSHERVAYRFGPFRLDPAGRRLTREDEPLDLTPKGFDVLVALVEARGAVVERDVLLDRVWPDTAVVEASLTQMVSVVRKVLGDRASEPGYIATIPGRGYQFTAPVEVVPGGAVGGEPGLEGAGGAPGSGSVAGPAHARRVAAAVAGLLALLLALAALAVSGRRSASDEDAAPSLAVLPLTVLTPETLDPALGVGLSDAITNRLSARRSLIVRPTQTVLAATQRELEPLALGRDLGVRYVLSGTLRRAGDEVRASVQLVDVEGGQPLWAATFDQSVDALFPLEDRISGRIVRLLSLDDEALVGTAASPVGGGALAYQELILGRARYLERTRVGFKAAERHFERALEHDPDYAPALGNLALIRAILASDGLSGRAPRPLLASAQEHAERAIELVPELPEAWVALGIVRMLEDYDWPGAIDAFEKAVRFDPSGFRGRYLLSTTLILAGDDEGAWEEARWLRLDGRITDSDVDGNHEYSAGILAVFLGRYREARETLAPLVAERPELGGVRLMLALSLDGLGRHDEALAELETAARTFESSRLGRAPLANYLGRSPDPARRARAREILDELEREPADAPMAELSLAVAHAGAGSKEEAIRHLRRAHESRAVLPIVVLRDPRLDPLRDQPGFQRLLEEMNLAPARSRPEASARHTAREP
jgi:DNA-binding winged helix-turn-helix (wHTH) protein/TolB-like protein/tetratricopeptide (TPR) repeat protein